MFAVITAGRSPLAKRIVDLAIVATALTVALQAPPSAAQTIDLVGQLDPYTGGNRYADVWGEGDFAYIGSFQGSGVGIIDISDPTTPVLVATYGSGPGGQFKDVKVYDGIGYFASDNGGGLHIVDVSTPSTPVFVTQVTSVEGGYDFIHNISVANGFLYEADSSTETLVVFDVSVPASPLYVRDIVVPGSDSIHDVTALGGRLYASGLAGFTYIYDVSNVGSIDPPLLGTVSSGSSSHSNWATSDGHLLISARETSNGEVRLYDISDPASPVLSSTLNAASLGISAFTPHNPVLFDDSLLFVSWYQAGVVAIDIRDPSNPALVGNYDTYPGAVSGYDGNWGVYPLLGLDRVLLSDLDAGLFVVDASAIAPVSVPTLRAPALLLVAIGLIAVARPRFRFGLLELR